MLHPTLIARLLLAPLGAAFLLFAAPAPAQTIGGEYQTLYKFDGNASSMSLGYSVSGAGDVNADGFDDLIVGAAHADQEAWATPDPFLFTQVRTALCLINGTA